MHSSLYCSVGRQPESVSFWKIGMGVFQSSFLLKKIAWVSGIQKLFVDMFVEVIAENALLGLFAVFLMHHCF